MMTREIRLLNNIIFIIISLMITALILLLFGCAKGYRVEGPIPVIYVDTDLCCGEKPYWFEADYMYVEKGYVELDGYVWNAKYVGRDKPKKEYKKLPNGYFKVGIDVPKPWGSSMYILTGMAVGTGVFIWPNHIDKKDLEILTK